MKSSKAKSGMSAVRMYPEYVQGGKPPNTYDAGVDTTYQTAIVKAIGHSEIHAAAVNNTSGKIQILHAWLPAGPWTQAAEVFTAVDPISGYHTASVKKSVLKTYARVKFIADGVLGANFELGAFLQPRASGDPASFSGSVSLEGTVTLANRETAVVNAAQDIFTTNAIVPKAGIIDVQFWGNKAAIWALEIHRGGNILTPDFRDGNQIPANSLQNFSVPCMAGDQFNLHQDQATHTVYALINFRPE